MWRKGGRKGGRGRERGREKKEEEEKEEEEEEGEEGGGGRREREDRRGEGGGDYLPLQLGNSCLLSQQTLLHECPHREPACYTAEGLSYLSQRLSTSVLHKKKHLLLYFLKARIRNNSFTLLTFPLE